MPASLAPGQPAPTFTLPDPDGIPVSLDSLLAQSPWLHLIFLRHLG